GGEFLHQRAIACFCLLQERFAPMAFPYVADRAGDEDAVVGLERTEADLNGKLHAVFATSEEFEACPHRPHAAGGEKSLSMLHMADTIALRHKHLHRLSRQFLAAIVEQFLRLRINEDDLA